MDPDLTAQPTTISGDLPIRIGKPMEASTSKDSLWSSKPTMTEPTPYDQLPKSQPQVGIYQTKLNEEVAIRAGEILACTGSKARRRRPKSKRGLGKPTGFEEYYADGPMTPAEHEENRRLYDLSVPPLYLLRHRFTDFLLLGPTQLNSKRIQEALTRYQWKRRMENDRRAIFLKYLQYGGINANQNYETSLSLKELEQMSNDEAQQARGQTMIPRDRQGLEINFEAVARGFLSSFFANHYNPESEERIKVATGTIRNFLTYLLYHDVCPEYKDDIHRARQICDIASVELWKNVQLIQQGPGPFNQSCSMLFGGRYAVVSKDTSDWMPAQCGPGILTPDAARKVVKFAVAGAGTYDQAIRFQRLFAQGQLSAKHIVDIDGFEVISISRPDSDVHYFYHEHARDLPVVGKVVAKSFRDPAKPETDMSPGERRAWREGKAPTYSFVFFLEENLLQHCYPGLRIVSDIWEINCGMYYFDEIIMAYPSFHLVLANDLMLRWKTPKEIVSEKPKLLQMHDEEWQQSELYDDPEGEGKLDDITEAVKEARKMSGLGHEAKEVGKE
ncbi:Argonaute-binding protein 1 [Penicillium rolfsii]|nr:Argonaute-binding protein 1 [Penicillium rolfsii]